MAMAMSPTRKRGKSQPRPEDPVAPGGFCDYCEEDSCICPADIKKKLHGKEQAFFPAADGTQKPWLRACVDEHGEKLLGCWLCMTFLGKDGVDGVSRNCAIHKGKMKITKNISVDTLKGHLGHTEKLRANLSLSCQAV